MPLGVANHSFQAPGPLAGVPATQKSLLLASGIDSAAGWCSVYQASRQSCVPDGHVLGDGVAGVADVTPMGHQDQTRDRPFMRVRVSVVITIA